MRSPALRKHVDFKSGAFHQSALHDNLSAHIIYDLPTNGQTQALAMFEAKLLNIGKVQKYVLDLLLGQSVAIIRYAHGVFYVKRAFFIIAGLSLQDI